MFLSVCEMWRNDELESGEKKLHDKIHPSLYLKNKAHSELVTTCKHRGEFRAERKRERSRLQ